MNIAPRQVMTRESTDILAIDDPDIAQAVQLIRAGLPAFAGRPGGGGDWALARAFEQRFHAALFRTPKEEILRVQLERAKTLLATSYEAIAMVAKMSGFASPAYFARAFRQRTGMAPSSYRSQQRLPARSGNR